MGIKGWGNITTSIELSIELLPWQWRAEWQFGPWWGVVSLGPFAIRWVR